MSIGTLRYLALTPQSAKIVFEKFLVFPNGRGDDEAYMVLVLLAD